MFGTIRKHQTWLWAVIITLTIVSFVIYFGPASRLNNGASRSGSYGTINGHRITEQIYLDAYREVNLYYFFMTGRWLSEESRQSRIDPERETYNWLLLTQKQEELGIHIGDDALAMMGQQLLRSLEQRAGIANSADLNNRFLKPRGLGMADFERYVRHFLGLQELISTFGVAGKLVTPQEAKALYEREHQEISAEAVFFSASNFLSSVTVDPQLLNQFFTNRIVNYVIPDRVQVSYVRFSTSNLMAQAETELGTNLNEVVEANFQRMGTNLFADAKSPQEAKARLREEVIRRQALEDAKRKAFEFANVLFDLKPARPENLQALAQTNGLTVGVTAPFEQDNPPADLQAGPEFVKAAFELTPEEPYSNPIPSPSGYYVLAYGKRLPRETPPLDQVRERVTADFKHSQALVQARMAASSVHTALTNGLAQGKSFDELCAVAKVKPVTLPAFSLSTRSLPEVEEFASLNSLKQAAFGTSPGKLSSFYSANDGFMMVYVKAKLPVDTAKMQTDLPAFVNSLRRSRQQEAFDDWFRREVDQGLRNTPIARQKTPPNMGSAAAKS
jgi:hypothetical protein